MLKPLIALVAAVAAIGLAAAGASAAGVPSPTPRPQPKLTTPASPTVQPSGQGQEQEQEPADDQGGVHGGPVARFHGEASQACNLTDVSKLSGNWTHGDYVTAVAAADPTKASQAAHSSCGKPAKAAGKGKGLGRSK